MISWLTARTMWRAPRRLVLGALGVAFPVAMLAATLLFVDDADHAMTRVALQPVQVEMRALGTSLDVDMTSISHDLGTVPAVAHAEPFAATDVVVEAPGAGKWTARLIAVDPSYFAGRPWLRVVSGTPGGGALLDEALRNTPGFASAGNVSIALPGDAPKLSLALPVTGAVDLRQATTWFSIPSGDVQGDVVAVPRAIVIDFSTFAREVLPVLQVWATHGGISPVFDPGSTDLPPVSLESHVSVDHSAYPPNPSRATAWSGQLRMVLERQAAGSILVTDNAAETLVLAQADATNARILFLLLGIPGVLAAGALGLAAGSALAEANRREAALLRLRGATTGQLIGVAAADAALVGLLGSIVGLLVAAAAVSVVTGGPVWSGVAAGRLATTAILALAVGAVTTVIRLFRLRSAGRRSEVAVERRLLERGWRPLWKRAYLDLVFIALGLSILGINRLAGGLSQTPIEGTSLALSFYVLLAPIFLWLGATFLAVRVVLAMLRRRADRGRSKPLPSWRAAATRWTGRRPARIAVALVLGTLAVAFGTQVLAFAATYRTAKLTDAQAALGSDLRLTPVDVTYELPPLGPGIAAVSPFRLVPARAGSDRKTIMAIDLPTDSAVSTMAPRMLEGQGPEALRSDPRGVLLLTELAVDFEVGPGDTLPITIFPDDYEKSTNLKLHVVGIYGAFPPTSPPPDQPAELVMSAAAIPQTVPAPPDFYLARVDPGRSVDTLAAELRRTLADRFDVTTIGDPFQRGLTALNLAGLGRIEAFGAALIAAIGVAVLGAFLVLERRREFAILRAVGADTPQVLVGPAQEGVVVVLGSVLIGVPVGLGLALLEVRVLSLFFALPPPLLTVPNGALAVFIVFMVTTSATAMAAALAAVTRVRPASVLREP
ncbi:ABC transporter permease [Mycolicibacterium sp.]|uniref:ABC transporter permease n=1 Tax=Mycolicibacterium sp. TaxID=2320850 RepID=UPI001A210C0C|nr:ABC transporter permease [Mycolicibacterium sp.]MBJ7341546.1 ABC transporter permease [Mycolicibacterium sp.]